MHSGENQTIAISVRRHYFLAGKFRKHLKMHNGGKSKNCRQGDNAFIVHPVLDDFYEKKELMFTTH